jgi:hypothetical protein
MDWVQGPILIKWVLVISLFIGFWGLWAEWIIRTSSPEELEEMGVKKGGNNG